MNALVFLVLERQAVRCAQDTLKTRCHPFVSHDVIGSCGADVPGSRGLLYLLTIDSCSGPVCIRYMFVLIRMGLTDVALPAPVVRDQKYKTQ